MTKGKGLAKAFRPPPLTSLLGGITPQRFFADHWQKQPLLVRQAVPDLERVLDRDGLFRLATDMDVESRLVSHSRGRWRLRHGPFEAAELEALPKRNWSLLVQGVNMLLPAGDHLLDAFNFVPYARLDDLMVSFAPNGGGVGPHFDSYDVFLIQGLGRRRWEISAQDDLELADGAPLRILKRFRVDQSWELEPGDMLYLPPRYAHNGVALGDCMTWSIGFRAPSAQEVVEQFLGYLQDGLQPAGQYSDPDLKYSSHPGEVPATMARRLKTMLRTIRWSEADVEEFLGRYLSEPKPQVYFTPPARPMSLARFGEAAAQRGVRLDAGSRLLYRNRRLFINGETVTADATGATLRQLADRREIAAAAIDDGVLQILYAWYRTGFVHLCQD